MMNTCESIPKFCVCLLHVLLSTGESIGGAVALDLLKTGEWQGPTVLMAPAFRHSQHMQTPETPLDIARKVIIIHGTKDTAVDIEDSRKFLEAHQGSGRVTLVEQDDDHDNHKIIDADQLRRLIMESLE